MFNDIKTRIELLPSKKLVGCKVWTSLANNKSNQVWQNFMHRKNDVLHQVNSLMYFLKVYDPLYFAEYNEGNAFYKWAAVEVSSYENIPDGMESVDLPGGLYAVFNYKGMINDTAFYNYIFNSWLPVSLYKIDDRPHFEILGEKYTNDDPESEEESWIPIRHRLLFGM